MKKSLRLLAVLSIVAILLSAFSVTSFAASPFKDVKTSRWSYKYINHLYQEKIVDGKGGGMFAPTDNITRAEFVKILGGIEGINPKSYATTQFKDVSSKKWYYGYVAWAVKEGVTTGTGKNTFSPDDKITREQMATMIYRYATKKGVYFFLLRPNYIFADANQIAKYATEPVSAMQRGAIISGSEVNGKHYFKPKDNATREEAAKMLSLLSPRIPKADYSAAYNALAAWVENNQNGDTIYGQIVGTAIPGYRKEVQSGTNYKVFYEIFYNPNFDCLTYGIIRYDYKDYWSNTSGTYRTIPKQFGMADFMTFVYSTQTGAKKLTAEGRDNNYLYTLSDFLPNIYNLQGDRDYFDMQSSVKSSVKKDTVQGAQYTQSLIFDKYIKNYNIYDLGYGV